MDESSDEYIELANRYATYSKAELLGELGRIARPANYKDEPSDEVFEGEGKIIWRQCRKKLAVFICKNRGESASKTVQTFLSAGARTFIQEMARAILGQGVIPAITAAMAAALAGLLYDELQSGIDVFCNLYYFEDQ
jgi:hypothetical protein